MTERTVPPNAAAVLIAWDTEDDRSMRLTVLFPDGTKSDAIDELGQLAIDMVEQAREWLTAGEPTEEEP